jgi:hypothetical protein
MALAWVSQVFTSLLQMGALAFMVYLIQQSFMQNPNQLGQRLRNPLVPPAPSAAPELPPAPTAQSRSKKKKAKKAGGVAEAEPEEPEVSEGCQKKSLLNTNMQCIRVAIKSRSHVTRQPP